MTPTRDEIIEGLMSKAQEFASSWSLVGGRFDDGSMIVEAEARKEELRAMLRALRDQREADAKMLDWLDAQRNDLVDYHCGEPMLMGHSWGVDGKCETVRQAITEAMSAQGEKS